MGSLRFFCQKHVKEESFSLLVSFSHSPVAQDFPPFSSEIIHLLLVERETGLRLCAKNSHRPTEEVIMQWREEVQEPSS